MKQELGFLDFQFSIHYTTRTCKLTAPGIPKNLFQCDMAVSLANVTKSCKGLDFAESHYHSRKKESSEYTGLYIIQLLFIILLQKGFHLPVWWQIHVFASSLLIAPIMNQIPTVIIPIIFFAIFKKNSNIYPRPLLSFIFIL